MSPYLSLTKTAPNCRRLWRLTTAALTVFASPSGRTTQSLPRSQPQRRRQREGLFGTTYRGEVYVCALPHTVPSTSFSVG